MTPDPDEYLRETRPWSSRAGGEVLLRGRRRDGGRVRLHFVHGNGFAGGVYWPMLREFLPDYSLFCHDIEGHGLSEIPARHGGPAHDAARIAAVIDEQGFDAQPLVGIAHSYGAALTALVAARAPQRFAALVLLDPIFLPPAQWLLSHLAAHLKRHPLQAGALRRRTRWPDRAAAAAHLRGRGVYAGWDDAALDCFVAHAMRDDGGERVLGCPSWLEAAIFADPVYIWPVLRRIRCPVLLLRGSRSYPFMPAGTARAGRRLPQAEIDVQPGGHCFMQEDPRDSAGRVRRFLARHGL